MHSISVSMVVPAGSVGRESACNEGDLGSIPGSGRSPGEGNDNSFQYSCLGNSMDGGALDQLIEARQGETQGN